MGDRLATIAIGPKSGGCCAPFHWWHFNPSSQLATMDMGQKLGAGEKLGAVPLLGELDPHLTQCGWGQGLPACQVSSWSIQPFGHNTPMSQTDRRDRQDRETERQTDRTTVRQHRANSFTNGRPKIGLSIGSHLSAYKVPWTWKAQAAIRKSSRSFGLIEPSTRSSWTLAQTVKPKNMSSSSNWLSSFKTWSTKVAAGCASDNLRL